jgi:16S rRNA (guanine527-N7)-methyltransferase
MRDKVLEILNSLPASGVDTASACEQILAFLVEWKKWSAKIDLTSESDELSVLRKHVFDSLQYARALRPTGFTMDIGSGAGFPGIPLKIIFPEMPMILVESRRKRANFLKSVAGALKLERLEIINARAEDLARSEARLLASFDQVIFKAVGPLAQCLEWGLPFLKADGRIVIKKEPGDPQQTPPGLRLREKIAIASLAGVASELLVYVKCST